MARTHRSNPLRTALHELKGPTISVQVLVSLLSRAKECTRNIPKCPLPERVEPLRSCLLISQLIPRNPVFRGQVEPIRKERKNILGIVDSKLGRTGLTSVDRTERKEVYSNPNDDREYRLGEESARGQRLLSLYRRERAMRIAYPASSKFCRKRSPKCAKSRLLMS